MRASTRPSRARGFTLIELVLSAATVGVLLLAAGGLIAASSRLLPRETDPAARQARARSALSRLADDARLATQVTTAPNTVTLTLPDQDDDGSPETVVYELRADRGELTRTWNTGKPQTLASAVASLSVWTRAGASSVSTVTPAVEGGPGVLAQYTDQVSDTAALTTTNQVGQYVAPRLPPDALGWRPTGLAFALRSNATLLPITVSVFRADSSGRPTGLAMATAIVPAGALPGEVAYVTIALPGMPELGPDDGICFTLAHASLLSVVTVPVERTGVQDSHAHLITSSLSGTVWTVMSSGSLNYRLLGTIRRPGTSTTALSRLRGLGVSLGVRSTGASVATVSAFVPTHNAPAGAAVGP